MYRLQDNFKTYDENKQPYSFVCERHTTIEDLHAGTDDKGFNMRSIGNRFILRAPKLNEFKLEMNYSYTYLAEFDPVFDIYFGYDRTKRCGQGLSIRYDLSGKIIVSYVLLNKMKTQKISSVEIDDMFISQDDIISLELNVNDISLNGKINNNEFTFCIESSNGYIALERKNFIGELILRDISLTSEDDINEEIIISEKTVEIPLTDGGDIPYLFSYTILKEDDIFYLDTKLFGGTASRKVNREDRPGQYVAEKDILTSPFVVLRNNNKERRFNIFCGEKVICDPNIFWECQKEFFGHPDIPIRARFVLDNFEINNSTTISYGYESLRCSGYANQSGGPSEHVFTLGGELIYSGQKLEETIFDLLSPEDKYAISLIPYDAYDYDSIIKHLKGNHYFHIDENIKFTLSLKTKLDADAFGFEAEIRDVYDSKTICNLKCNISKMPWDFGYTKLDAAVETKKLPIGVYRIVYNIYYGDTVYKRFVKTFEVFDENASVSPAVASGLPYVFSMPNEQKWLASNTFDLWNPKPSCDTQHYISCITNTPLEAERQRVWEVIKPFGREWFAWLARRTMKDPDISKHMDVVKNADYLYIHARTESFPLRNDLYLVKTYQNPLFREYLHEFLNCNPEIADTLLYKVPERDSGEFVKADEFNESGELPEHRAFTYEHLRDLMEKCHKEWMSFANAKILEAHRKQNEFLKEINPGFRRSCYGPFNLYVQAPLSYHTIKAFGNLPYETLSEDVYTGFCIFEDYPASCAYQTCRGAFAVMTILLHSPNLRIYPEQYKGGIGGCIDGAVKFAHAPMGKYHMPLYYNTTHAFEFVYNTPQRTEDGYNYWTTYGFHRPDHSPDMWDEEVRGWKTVADIKPVRPLRSMAVVAEYFDEEDKYSDEIISIHGHTNLVNTSEEAHGYIYECARKNGFNAPFVLKLNTLKHLNAVECDVLVIPSMRYADDEVKKEIRRLCSEGVSIIAVSHVDGLEDIFGVEVLNETRETYQLEYDGESEYIYPFDVCYNYKPLDAETVLTANGMPVIIKKGRAALINAPLGKLGYEPFVGMEGKQRRNLSKLFEKALSNLIYELSNPIVYGENVGVTLFEGSENRKQLLCIDYSDYLNVDTNEKNAVVRLNCNVKDVISPIPVTKLYDKNGYVKEIKFKIEIHGYAMFELI